MIISTSRQTTLVLSILVLAALPSTAWIVAPYSSSSLSSRQSLHTPHRHQSSRTRTRTKTKTTTTTTTIFADNNNNGGGPLSFLFNPYESKIPDALKDEIYAAEARTPAAQERGVRVAMYSLIAFVGIVLAFFSAFITELRNTPLPPGETGDPLAIAGFTWVYSNFLVQFILTNKLGGGLCLLLGAGSGLMAEAELDTKRINAEKIFEELERRRKQKGSSSRSSSKQRKGKKRRPGKEKKRLQALSELVVEEPITASSSSSSTKEEAIVASKETTVESPSATTDKTDEAPKQPEKSDGGIMGKIKGFYEQADSMAASQALLLNKKLEEGGLVEKITDETGLKVVGREEAAKLQGKDKKEDEK